MDERLQASPTAEPYFSLLRGAAMIARSAARARLATTGRACSPRTVRTLRGLCASVRTACLSTATAVALA